jgi:hypothetical protein
MAAAGIIDFFLESQRRSPRRTTSGLAEMALDKCEETLMRRDWGHFGHWHAVFLRERNRLRSDQVSRLLP